MSKRSQSDNRANPLTAVSLFTGAGGMDIGFAEAGFRVIWANDIDPVACQTYAANHPGTPIRSGDLRSYFPELKEHAGVSLVFGGPPCQGFSVAGKMDPNDSRSELLWTFLDVVQLLRPKAFVCENVKALAALEKWSPIRQKFLQTAHSLGYGCSYCIVNARDFGVPQSRERVFFVGILGQTAPLLDAYLCRYKRAALSVRDVIKHLGRAGSQSNKRVCRAKITLASRPIMRKSPYAGMLFNGLGRPLKLDGASATLPASMGGNKTPIVDEKSLYCDSRPWVEEYHSELTSGRIRPEFGDAPARLRRLTVDEAILLQTFPKDYIFHGGTSAVFRQIGNSVPPKLAEAVARATIDILSGVTLKSSGAELPLFSAPIRC